MKCELYEIRLNEHTTLRQQIQSDYYLGKKNRVELITTHKVYYHYLGLS